VRAWVGWIITAHNHDVTRTTSYIHSSHLQGRGYSYAAKLNRTRSRSRQHLRTLSFLRPGPPRQPDHPRPTPVPDQATPRALAVPAKHLVERTSPRAGQTPPRSCRCCRHRCPREQLQASLSSSTCSWLPTGTGVTADLSCSWPSVWSAVSACSSAVTSKSTPSVVIATFVASVMSTTFI